MRTCSSCLRVARMDFRHFESVVGWALVVLGLLMLVPLTAQAQDSVLTAEQIESLDAQLDHDTNVDNQDQRLEVGAPDRKSDLWEEYQRYRDKDDIRTSGELVKIGDSVTVSENERINGDVVSIGGSVDIFGYVDGDVVAIGGDVRLHDGAEVGGDAVSVGGQVREMGDAHVHGEKVSISIPIPGNWSWDLGLDRANRRTSQFFSAGFSLVFLLVGLLLVFLFQAIGGRRMDVMSRRIEAEPGQSFLIGILGAFGTPLAALIATILLAITIVGLLLVPVLGIFIWILMFGGFVALLLAVGRRIAHARSDDEMLAGTRSPYYYLLIGFVAVNFFGILASVFELLGGGFLSAIAVLFDVINLFVLLFAVTLGYGGLLLSRFGSQLPGGSPAFVPAGTAAAAGAAGAVAGFADVMPPPPPPPLPPPAPDPPGGGDPPPDRK